MDQGTAATPTQEITEKSVNRRHIVERPRLTKLLDETEAKTILLIAPAGYGKTTLARQWLSNKRSAWYKASAAAGDPVALISGIARAVTSVIPTAGNRLAQRLHVGGETDAAKVRVLLEMLLEDLEAWPKSAWLMIDDYHVISSAAAEEVIVELQTKASNVRLMLASRERPVWVSPRHLLYGEVDEIGRSTLAMTQDEARRVLPKDKGETARGLIALAEGWPAVVGLAAFTELTDPPAGDIPETLLAFIADELYAATAPTLKQALLELAVASNVDRDLAQALFGDTSTAILEEAASRGFLTESLGDYDMHPLIRQFLRQRLLEFPAAEARAVVEKILSIRMVRHDWDAAFTLISDFDLPEMVPRLATVASADLFAEGRIVTISQWIDVARSALITSPELDLIEAELRFREARYREAEEISLAVSEACSDRSCRSRALHRAAQSAHFNDRLDHAVRLHEKAALSAITPKDSRQALWGQFVTLAELGRYEAAVAVLQKFEELDLPDTEALFRQAQARLMLSVATGGIREAVDYATGRRHLLDRPSDPLVRTAFCQTFAYALVQLGQYEKAMEITDVELEDSNRFRLDFVLPHGLVHRASAYLGQRRFAECRNDLRAAEHRAAITDDLHSLINCKLVSARLALAQQDAQKAVQLLEVTWNRQPIPAMKGEYLAVQALASACAGGSQKVQTLTDQARDATDSLDARAIARWASLIADFDRTQNSKWVEDGSQALYESHAAGLVDPFVVAYRACPRVLKSLGSNEANLPVLTEVLSDARDFALARKVGVMIYRASHGSLTQREAEVLDLVRQGLSNAKIARALWIEASTVKVHVRHIFDKLGVSSRTEAAVRASELGLASGD